jgi:hypothetical protein
MAAARVVMSSLAVSKIIGIEGILFELLANLKSVHRGHHYIQDDKANGPALDDIQALVTARRADH